MSQLPDALKHPGYRHDIVTYAKCTMKSMALVITVAMTVALPLVGQIGEHSKHNEPYLTNARTVKGNIPSVACELDNTNTTSKHQTKKPSMQPS